MGDSDEGGGKRDLRSLLEGYGSKPASDIQKKKDAQLTNYEAGSGEGLDEIRAALQKDPENDKLKDWLAFSLYSNNQVQEAIQIYIGLAGRHPENITYHYYLGNSYAKLGQVQRAIERWKEVVSIDPYGKMGRKAQARIDQAKKLLRAVHPTAGSGIGDRGGPPPTH